MSRSPGADDWDHLQRVLVHEFFKCDQAFLDFADFSAVNFGGRTDKRLLLAMFDAYARFPHHLYEFYLGNIKRERGRLGTVPHEECDRILQAEAEKLMRIRRERILTGDAPRWENHVSYYESPVPSDFACDFRQARNRVAHADYRRAGAAGATGGSGKSRSPRNTTGER